MSDPGQYIVEVVSLPDPGDGYRGSTVTALVNVHSQDFGEFVNVHQKNLVSLLSEVNNVNAQQYGEFSNVHCLIMCPYR